MPATQISKHTQLSRNFLAELKLHELPAYVIAQRAGLNPATPSKLICGIERVRPNDPRIVAVGKVLGLSSEQCFVPSNEAPEKETVFWGCR